MCGYTPKGQPVWGPQLNDVGEDDTYSWRTKKFVSDVPAGSKIHEKDQYFAVTEDCLNHWCPPSKRAKRDTRARILIYTKRIFEPFGMSQTGEPLFDQDSPFLRQSFGCGSNHDSTWHALGYVMPHDELADLMFSNSMKIGRAKRHSEMAQEAPGKAREKKRRTKRALPNNEEDNEECPEMAIETEEDDEDWWGMWRPHPSQWKDKEDEENPHRKRKIALLSNEEVDDSWWHRFSARWAPSWV